ncbi:uncharacterized protein BX663DRAFT_504648 [Cokeromyces recurvatus]|uniref:uncharacterized protein n=1 Tax=Cokeromyces recurvatus TaxID=90255 RepID=UPI00221F7A91|nr:uncharacterized protein BX663DRAFT_504648 [Cokeromyces recurvatus]KAI7904313.1 hypothetical protein BX663DRAFT_504648 [Cokeromyces recurvatus]
MIYIDIIKQSTDCKQRVAFDSNVQLQYISRFLDKPNQVIENKTIVLKPGNTALIKGLEQEIQGMCVGEIRRLTVPNTAMIYDIEILEIKKPQLITPLFWLILCSIGLAYIVFGKLAAKVDREKDTTRRFKKK